MTRSFAKVASAIAATLVLASAAPAIAKKAHLAPHGYSAFATPAAGTGAVRVGEAGAVLIQDRDLSNQVGKPYCAGRC